jgi:hypothetical protein
MKLPCRFLFGLIFLCICCKPAAARETLLITNYSNDDVCQVLIAPAGTSQWFNLMRDIPDCLHTGYNITVPWQKRWHKDEDWSIRIIYGNNRQNTSNQTLTLKPGMMIDILYDSVKYTDQFNVNWPDVPVIDNMKDLAVYMRHAANKLQKVIPVRYSRGFLPDHLDAVDKTGIAAVATYNVPSDEDSNETRIIYKPLYYPGARIVYAVQNRDMSILSSTDLAILRAATPVADKARQQPTLLQRELFIHDAIIKMAEYKSVDFDRTAANALPPGRSAQGVLLEGKANCQGFTDAFYLLGNLAGLNVGYWSGIATEPHAWNTITIDGLTYFVDATNDQPGFIKENLKHPTYVYFNAPREIIGATHSWNTDYEAGLKIAEKVDANFYYTTAEHNATGGKLFGTYYISTQNGFLAIANHILAGKQKVANFMLSYEPQYEKSARYTAQINKYLSQLIQKNGYGSKNISYHIGIKTNPKWKYMFFTVYR